MSELLPRSIFYHVPKTGGTFVSKLLCMFGKQFNFPVFLLREQVKRGLVPFHRNLGGRSPHCIYKGRWPNKYKERPRFCFVRHPADWYKSFWAMLIRNKIDKVDKIRGWELGEFMDRDFNIFIENIINNGFPYSYEFFNFFSKECKYIGKQESLREDLIIILEKCGEKFDEYLIRKHKKVNVNRHVQPIYTKNNYERILRLEKNCLNDYGYDFESQSSQDIYKS